MTSGCVELLRTRHDHERRDVLLHRRRGRRGADGRLAGAADARGDRRARAGTASAAWEAMRNGISRAHRPRRPAVRAGRARRARVRAARGVHAAGRGARGRSRSTPASGGRCCTCTWPRPTEEDAALRAEHGSVPALLDRLGVFGGRVLAAHCVQLSDDEIWLLAARQVAAAHCPGSNAKLAAGVARVTALRRAGRAGGAGHGRPGVRRRPRPVDPGPPRRPVRPRDQRRRCGVDGCASCC